MQKNIDLSRMSFLVVEDNPHMRSILRSILSGFGVRAIIEASDGAEGLELLIERSPDIVLCDWKMTPMSGSEFTRILRKDRDPSVSTTPVIIISAHARKNVIMEAIQLGIHGFIAKPVSPSVLYERIVDVIHKHGQYGRSKGFFGRKPPALRGDKKVIDLSGMGDDSSNTGKSGPDSMAFL